VDLSSLDLDVGVPPLRCGSEQLSHMSGPGTDEWVENALSPRVVGVTLNVPNLVEYHIPPIRYLEESDNTALVVFKTACHKLGPHAAST
jgi:hypothetical protein